jgi:endonuclease-3
MKRQERIDALKKTVFKMYPDATTELEYDNEFQLLIAILMSAQATDKQVNIINRNFFEHFKAPED